jgi:4-hydroxythreonine-4-phosphate dehydrogenase
VGQAGVFRREVRALGAALEVVECSSPEIRDGLAIRPTDRSVPPLVCVPGCCDAVLDVPLGRVDARAGHAAYDCLCTATSLAQSGEVDAIVTAPLSKAALHLAGYHYPGHTEILAERCASGRFAMMLYLPPGAGAGGRAGLGVVHATLHVALREALAQLTADRVRECCHLAGEGLRWLGCPEPRIGVAAVNPHAGEDGLFGSEEATLIAPAVERARKEGLDVAGPLPVDTLFVRARQGEFDAVVAMYHDQGHIALKLLGMHAAVNVTLGLPITRTSPAHGTAKDIAAEHRADPSGMIAAILTAAQLVRP